MSKTRFKEEQRFRNPGFLTLLLLLSGLVVYRLGMEVFENTYSVYSIGLTVLIGAVVGGVWYAVFRSRLRIKLSDKNLKLKTKGVIGSRIKLPTEEIVDHEFVDIKPSARWAGALTHPSGDFRCIDFGGRSGLFVKMRNGKSYFIGSDDLYEKRDDLKHILST